ncbi:hypothetical protein ILYODFUR_007538, partial [Ilyodon furcidens]
GFSPQRTRRLHRLEQKEGNRGGRLVPAGEPVAAMCPDDDGGEKTLSSQRSSDDHFR